MAYEKVNLNVIRRAGSLLSRSSGRKWGMTWKLTGTGGLIAYIMYQ